MRCVIPRETRSRKRRNASPGSDYELVNWMDNFTSKLDQYAAHFGLAPAEVTTARNDYVWLAWAVLQADMFPAGHDAGVRLKELLRDGSDGGRVTLPPEPALWSVPASPLVTPGVLPRLHALIRHLTSHPFYAQEIGRDLGVTGLRRFSNFLLRRSGRTATPPKRLSATNRKQPGRSSRLDQPTVSSPETMGGRPQHTRKRIVHRQTEAPHRCAAELALVHTATDQ